MRFVPAFSLVSGMVMARDIISNNSSAFMLKKGVVLNDKAIDYIRKNGYMGAYISDALSNDVELEEAVDQQLFRKGIEAVEGENVGSILGVATDIVAQLTAKRDVSIDLFDLRSFDDYTYHHSVNVAVYAVAVGKKLGLKEEELNLLSMAAICHDLGKSKIDKDIINKPGKLTDEEFAQIKSHPRHSFSILYDNPEVPSIVRQAVLYHHENENGSGYPYGKEGKDIPIFAKIIHAVDVYDALTSKRPYKDPFAPADAYQYINNGVKILFDPKVVAVMSEVVPAYPPGIDVILSDGSEALVVGHTANALRPRIKLAATGQIVNLYTDETYKDITIEKSGIMPADYVGDIDMLNEDRSAVKEVTSKNKILIVDDNFLLLKATAGILEDKYEVITLQSGLEAIRYIVDGKEAKPDLIIMDVEMPVMNGIATIKNLRKTDGFNIPVMFLTGNANRDTILKCREVGAVDFVVKPANPVYLRERVEMALRYVREL